MIVNKENFDAWMEQIMERFDRLESKLFKEEKVRCKIDGELLLDNQDVCLMLNISKRTLQRYRSRGWLPYRQIDQKTYYMESEVLAFVKEYLQ